MQIHPSLQFEHLLIILPVEDIPSHLLPQLSGTFKKISSFVYDPRLNASGPFPSPADLASADAILTLFLPPGLTSIAQTPQLKLLQLVSAGYNQVTSTPFYLSIPKENSQVVCSSASGIHAVAIGEHCLSTTLVMLHGLHKLFWLGRKEERWVKPEEVDGRHMFVKELRGKKVGIVGYGHIGAETARMFHALGADIVALTRSGVAKKMGGYIIPSTGDPLGLLPSRYYSSSDPKSRFEFFSDCDIVISTVPSSPETKDFVGEAELKAMKGDGIFVNIGRGDTVDQEKLIVALQAKPVGGEKMEATGSLRIGGASLDVTDPEPLPDGHILFTLPNVFLTPHMSGLSEMYWDRTVDLLLSNVQRLKEGKGGLNAFCGKGESVE